MQLPDPDTILQGDFWPEAVRVVRCRHVGARIHLEEVGERTQQFFRRRRAGYRPTLGNLKLDSFDGEVCDRTRIDVERGRLAPIYQCDQLSALFRTLIRPDHLL